MITTVRDCQTTQGHLHLVQLEQSRYLPNMHDTRNQVSASQTSWSTWPTDPGSVDCMSLRLSALHNNQFCTCKPPCAGVDVLAHQL